ncbi:hypothetical protein V1525DRAFT_409827 [Lipomyces kononenkoae]|uniref:Uncharacterized protein n=1 Tax=Lipomyces kononenkoae TaxID=34357 RepID=A0ACC3SVS4_LIPKO
MATTASLAAVAATAATSILSSTNVTNALSQLDTAVPTTPVGLGTTPASPVISQFARIMRSLATVIVKQTSEVDIPDRRIGTFVAYLTSPFALLCMLMAIVLNRTVVFASVRRPQTLPVYARLLIRSVAIVQLTRATGPLLTALKCYSPALAKYIPEYFAIEPDEGKCPGPDILWHLYKAFCTGHFVETFSSALQGRVPSPDTGMTLFEYSLAFQEAQSAQRPSVEVLVISLIWALNYLTFLVISVLDLQNYRLIPSTFFGIISLSYFAASTYHGRAQFFPTVWVIGFAPHLAVLYVIILCGSIYLLASLFAGGTSNLQSSVRTVNVSLSEDFYSCLLKLGILVLTSAADATYMAEGPSLVVPETTWIEALEFNRRAGFEYINEIPVDPEDGSRGLRKRLTFSADAVGDYNSAFNNSFGVVAPSRPSKKRRRRHSVSLRHASPRQNSVKSASGYGNHNVRVGGNIHALHGSTAASQRKAGRFGRFVLLYRVRMAYKLVLWCLKMCINLTWKALSRLNRRWHVPVNMEDENVVDGSIQQNVVDASNSLSDEDYYSLFLQGDQLPDEDPSGDFEPSDDEDDFTTLENDEDDTEWASSSALAVAQAAGDTSELFPELSMLDISLSSLLLPRTPEERQLQRVMVAHMSANEIVTRAKMGQYEDRLYGSENVYDDYSDDSGSDSFDDESMLILSLINERRRHGGKTASTSGYGIADDNDDGITAYSPSLCVVCHAAQRNIVLWPCRCLAVCEECRVSLALRNFKGCVCCRRDVVSFSRLYVP